MFVQEMKGQIAPASWWNCFIAIATAVILLGLAWSQANRVFASSKVRQVPEMEVNSSVKDCLVCTGVIGRIIASEGIYIMV